LDQPKVSQTLESAYVLVLQLDGDSARSRHLSTASARSNIRPRARVNTKLSLGRKHFSFILSSRRDYTPYLGDSWGPGSGGSYAPGLFLRSDSYLDFVLQGQPTPDDFAFA
jgi:hypothetical protein